MTPAGTYFQAFSEVSKTAADVKKNPRITGFSVIS
jgi:hypothetical protein